MPRNYIYIYLVAGRTRWVAKVVQEQPIHKNKQTNKRKVKKKKIFYCNVSLCVPNHSSKVHMPWRKNVSTTQFHIREMWRKNVWCTTKYRWWHACYCCCCSHCRHRRLVNHNLCLCVLYILIYRANKFNCEHYTANQHDHSKHKSNISVVLLLLLFFSVVIHLYCVCTSTHSKWILTLFAAAAVAAAVLSLAVCSKTCYLIFFCHSIHINKHINCGWPNKHANKAH